MIQNNKIKYKSGANGGIWPISFETIATVTTMILLRFHCFEGTTKMIQLV